LAGLLSFAKRFSGALVPLTSITSAAGIVGLIVVGMPPETPKVHARLPVEEVSAPGLASSVTPSGAPVNGRNAPRATGDTATADTSPPASATWDSATATPTSSGTRARMRTAKTATATTTSPAPTSDTPTTTTSDTPTPEPIDRVLSTVQNAGKGTSKK